MITLTNAMQKDKFRFHYDFVVDLHGRCLEDAIYELEKILFSGKYNTIMVVHGIGEGILRCGIRNYLSKNSFVRDINFGEDLNIPGGSGVTIAYLQILFQNKLLAIRNIQPLFSHGEEKQEEFQILNLRFKILD